VIPGIAKGSTALNIETFERRTMSKHRIAQLRTFEGRQVSLSLRNGTRIDDCQLVSGGRRGVGTVWVFANGGDSFLPLHDVTDVWQV
jgi:hypothetical protein